MTLELRAHGAHTEVRITETVERGVGRLVPQPLLDVPIGWRNVETLRRLAYLAEGRT